MGIDIRCCETQDLPSLHLLYQQLQPGDTTTFTEIEQGFHAMCAQPGCDIYVAELDGRVAGAFVLYILPNMTRNGRPAAIVENIVVDEAHRGQGIGRAMLEYARAMAQTHGCYKLSLTSNAKRTEAHEFYRRCGMMQHGVSFRYVL